MQSNTNSLVTAPKVFSNLNYYKSHHPFYAHQQQQQSFKNKQYINTVSPLQSSIHSANNVTMATAVGVDFTDNSLPPLSHLLTANDSVPHSQCKKWQMPSLEHHNRLKDEVFMMHPLYSSTTQPELFPHTHSVRSHHLPSPPISVDNGMINNEGHQKTFSFVPIPGVQHKKRPRRKHHEVERLYKCNFQNCTKAYGTLNHLNAHVSMQKHGPKRQPSEFKELRKMWRKQKRENKMCQKSRDEHRLSTWSVDSQQSYAHYMPQWRPCYGSYEFMPSDY